MTQAQPAPGTGEQKAVKPIKLGMAGLGIGGGMILQSAERMPEIEIFAAADTRKSALDAFQTRYEGRVYDTVEALCADPDIDVIWVATPNNMHAEHVVMAANAGKHVVSEKPMALNVEQCEAMVEAAEKNGVLLSCGHTFSLSPGIQTMRKVIQSGELGQLRALNCWLYTDWMLKPRMPEEIDVNLGGGVVYRHGPHVLDSIRLLGGGMVRSVRAQTGSWLKERPNAPGNYSAFIEFENGMPVTVAYDGYGYFYTSELTWGLGSRLYSQEEAVATRKALRAGEFDVEAEKEAMRFLGGGRTGTEAARQAQAAPGAGGGGQNISFGVYIASCDRGDIRQSPKGLLVYDDEGVREVPLSGERVGGNGELMEMYRAIREGGTIKHDGHWGMATLELIAAIMQSGRERREIRLTHQCEVRY
jgi:phthalate 4,5-cis-dihydrodiol dehydrogenase